MLVIGHTAIGVATGLLIPNPWAAFGIGVVSHHLADWVPHFDAGSFWAEEERKVEQFPHYGRREYVFVAIDLILTLGLLILLAPYLSSDRWPTLAAGMIGANLPDLVHHVPFWNRPLRKIGWIRWWHNQLHRKYHSTVPAKLWYVGTVTQLVTIGLVVWLVISHQ